MYFDRKYAIIVFPWHGADRAEVLQNIKLKINCSQFRVIPILK